jgi:hypothetical protein
MWMSNKNGAEPPVEDETLAEIQSTTRGAFRLVYGFILQAVKGDKATANLIFEDYLCRKTIRRTAVNLAALRQRGTSNRRLI